MRLSLKTWVRVRKNGTLVWEGPNHVVATGRIRLAQLCIQDSNLLPRYIAIGDDGAETEDADTDLSGTEIERVLASVTRDDNSLIWEASFGATIVSPTVVREFAIFDANLAGVMLCRVRPADFTITPGDVIGISWELRFGDAI